MQSDGENAGEGLGGKLAHCYHVQELHYFTAREAEVENIWLTLEWQSWAGDRMSDHESAAWVSRWVSCEGLPTVQGCLSSASFALHKSANVTFKPSYPWDRRMEFWNFHLLSILLLLNLKSPGWLLFYRPGYLCLRSVLVIKMTCSNQGLNSLIEFQTSHFSHLLSSNSQLFPEMLL